MSRRPKHRVEIDGAVAVVTGAGRGIGRATALALAERGARVVAVDLHGDTAGKTAAACRELGRLEASSYEVDVAKAGDVRELAATIESEVGPVAVVVNNAGVGMTGRFLDMSLEDWAWIRSINLDGVLNGCAAFGPAMVARGRGHVVNLSSGLGYTPTATEPAYVTTKAGVLAFSQCLRADWSKLGVGVTAICPGVINTPIIDATRFVGAEGAERKAKTTKVFRRGHKPEQVAAAIVDAVDRDRAVVPVGFEAKAGWWLHRYAPLAVTQAMARGSLR